MKCKLTKLDVERGEQSGFCLGDDPRTLLFLAFLTLLGRKDNLGFVTLIFVKHRRSG